MANQRNVLHQLSSLFHEEQQFAILRGQATLFLKCVFVWQWITWRWSKNSSFYRGFYYKLLNFDNSVAWTPSFSKLNGWWYKQISPAYICVWYLHYVQTILNWRL